MRIDVECRLESLARELWSFELYTFSGSDLSLKLIAFTFRIRETTRHKWKDKNQWRDEPFRKNPIPHPEIPTEVKEALGNRLCDIMRALVAEVK